MKAVLYILVFFFIMFYFCFMAPTFFLIFFHVYVTFFSLILNLEFKFQPYTFIILLLFFFVTCADLNGFDLVR